MLRSTPDRQGGILTTPLRTATLHVTMALALLGVKYRHIFMTDHSPYQPACVSEAMHSREAQRDALKRAIDKCEAAYTLRSLWSISSLLPKEYWKEETLKSMDKDFDKALSGVPDNLAHALDDLAEQMEAEPELIVDAAEIALGKIKPMEWLEPAFSSIYYPAATAIWPEKYPPKKEEKTEVKEKSELSAPCKGEGEEHLLTKNENFFLALKYYLNYREKRNTIHPDVRERRERRLGKPKSHPDFAFSTSLPDA